jgi:hypothetical protein
LDIVFSLRAWRAGRHGTEWDIAIGQERQRPARRSWRHKDVTSLVLYRRDASTAEHPDDDVERPGPVIREELRRLFTWEERHRRLAARLIIASGLTLLVLAAGSVLIWAFESGKKGGNIHGFGDAVFFTAVQLLTVSSSITNPVTPAGKVVDVALEAWAIFVVTAVAGSFAAFFSSGDSS